VIIIEGHVPDRAVYLCTYICNAERTLPLKFIVRALLLPLTLSSWSTSQYGLRYVLPPSSFTT